MTDREKGTAERAEDESESGNGTNDAETTRSPESSGPHVDDAVGPSDGEQPGKASEFEELVERHEATITVVGCGGAGSNTVARLAEEGTTGARLVALNTDAQHLSDVPVETRLLIGRQQTKGLGAGDKPWVGEEAALDSQGEIRDAIEGSDMVFVTAGLGGGTGTGSAPVVANLARATGALTIAVVTTPFEVEGRLRSQNAEVGLERLRRETDTAIVIPNDRILDIAGNLPLQQAFTVADEILMHSVKGIADLITTTGLVNLDFSDVRTILEDGDVAMIGLGESRSDAPAQDAVRDAIRSPLLDVDLSRARAALVNVTGGPDMTIEQAEMVPEEIYKRIDENARIIWGTSIKDSLEGTIRTLVIVTGVDSPQIYGSTRPESERDRRHQPNGPRLIDRVD